MPGAIVLTASCHPQRRSHPSSTLLHSFPYCQHPLAVVIRLFCVLQPPEQQSGVQNRLCESNRGSGASKEVGAKVIYQGREMTVSKGIDVDGELQLLMADYSGVIAFAEMLKSNST